MEKLNLEYWRQSVVKLSTAFENEEDRLCSLDGAIGDGDHGTSMALGFREAVKQLSTGDASDIGRLLKITGNAFVGSVGGVTGIVFGTLFIGAGKKVEGRTELDSNDLAGMFASALETIKVRGKVQEQDKSMVDALSPAVEALKKAAENALGPDRALILAHEAAEEGMEATRGFAGKVGRARYQKEKGIGHIDAGAASTALIFGVLAEAAG